MSKHQLNRRAFLTTVGVGAGLAGFAIPSAMGVTTDIPERKFFVVLSCGRIDVKASFLESVDLAVKHGFEGVDPNDEYFSRLSDEDLQKLLIELKAKNLKLGAAGLPVDFRKDEATFSEGLKKLSTVAGILERAGVTRVSTWISLISRISAGTRRACASARRS